ncbi:tyrosine-type recombinase/integrase [Paenibacillus wulumuqiensis]|uniref:tyrosine-type recombinase/integrase n=1 Tax=Paenibacillus wulumuqiensis TaxID=1567107 RepID=UPI00061996D4|nr:tyrosine-type recombinase/integrase [Paenibacillus wulumuqiensis]
MTESRRRRNHVTKVVDESTDIDLAVASYLRNCELRNLTKNTTNSYRDALHELTLLLGDIGVQIPRDITKAHISIVIDNKRKTRINRGIGEYPSDQTINKLIRTWRAFFNYLVEEGHLAQSPMSKLGAIRSEKRIIETFTDDQLRMLFDAPNKKTFTGYRDYVIMSTLLDTGVRISELERLDLSDINWADRILRVYGKGRKERFVPFSRRLEKMLRTYLELRGSLSTEALFVNIDDKRFKSRGMQQTIKNYGDITGIKGVRCSPHTFRHTCAKLYIMNGGDAFSLQKLLGHESLVVTRMYVNLFSQDLSKQHQKFSPLDNLR